jgi:hypothetical protein
MSRTSTHTITFQRSFLLPGMEVPHTAGTFELQIQEEPIDVVWEAYHRTLTIMLTSAGRVEAWPVSETDLENALAVDQGSVTPSVQL